MIDRVDHRSSKFEAYCSDSGAGSAAAGPRSTPRISAIWADRCSNCRRWMSSIRSTLPPCRSRVCCNSSRRLAALSHFYTGRLPSCGTADGLAPMYIPVYAPEYTSTSPLSSGLRWPPAPPPRGSPRPNWSAVSSTRPCSERTRTLPRTSPRSMPHSERCARSTSTEPTVSVVRISNGSTGCDLESGITDSARVSGYSRAMSRQPLAVVMALRLGITTAPSSSHPPSISSWRSVAKHQAANAAATASS